MEAFTMRSFGIAIYVAVALTLNACGGGSGSSPTPVVSTESELADTPISDGPTTDIPVENAPVEDAPIAELPEFDGSRPAITDLYSQAQIDALEQIGLVFNLGDQPPNIEGTFRIDPTIVQASTVPFDDGASGFEISSSTVTFSNQDNSTLTVDLVQNEDTGGSSIGNGSFISGNGQLFTVYFVTETTIGGFTADSTITLSGVVSDVGIENVQIAGFLLDDRGESDSVFIPNNTGRLAIDEDGFSERVAGNGKIPESLATTTSKNLISR